MLNTDRDGLISAEICLRLFGSASSSFVSVSVSLVCSSSRKELFSVVFLGNGVIDKACKAATAIA